MSSYQDQRRLQRRYLPADATDDEPVIPAPPIESSRPDGPAPLAEEDQLPSYESVAHDVPPPVSDANLARNYSISGGAAVFTIPEREDPPPDYRTDTYLHDPSVSEAERRQRQETERWRRRNYEERRRRAMTGLTLQRRAQPVVERPKGLKKIWHAIKYI